MPEGWFARESIQVFSPEVEGHVVAFADLLTPDTTLEQYAGAYAEALARDFPGYEELAVETVTLRSGATALLRRFRWRPPEGESVAQVQLYAVEDGQGVVATASAAPAVFESLEPQLRELLLGISLSGTGAGGGVLRQDQSPRSRTYAQLDAGRLTSTPEQAFGLGPIESEEAVEDEAQAAWKEARSTWQEARDDR